MKQLVVAVAIVLTSGLLIAQGRSTEAREKKNEQVEQFKEDHQAPANADVKGKPDKKMAERKEPKDKDKPNQEMKPHGDHGNGNGHAYGKNKGDLSGREFGQHRAAEAHAKKDRPKNDEEAEETITIVHKETKETIGFIEDKLQTAREKLEEMKKEGSMSEAEYTLKTTVLEGLEKRRADLEERLGGVL